MPDTFGEFDAERVCRVCLREVGDFYFIYDEAPVEQGANIAQILNECTRYTCERFDKMPHHMCDTCIKAACQAYRFKRDAEKAYRSLVAILGQAPTTKPNSSDACTQTEQLPMLPCGICNEEFLNIIELRLHRNQEHKYIEELKCKLCNAQFEQVRQLRNHLVEKHDQQTASTLLQRRVECRECNRAFSRRDHLLRHMRTVHKSDKQRRTLTEEDGTVWAPADETSMHSGDELESAAVLLNAQCSDDDETENIEGVYQSHINPISSNEEADDDEDDAEAKQSLWLHIKPDPDIEPELERGLPPKETKVKREKRRRKVKMQIDNEQTEEEEDPKSAAKNERTTDVKGKKRIH